MQYRNGIFFHIVQFWVAVKRIGPRNLRQADKRWRVTVHRYFFNALLVIYKSASPRPLFKRKWNVPKITGCSLSFSDLWKTLGSNCNIFLIDSYEFSELECSLFTYDALLWNMYSIVKEQRWKQTKINFFLSSNFCTVYMLLFRAAFQIIQVCLMNSMVTAAVRGHSNWIPA